MATIAKGSKSQLAWDVETAYGVADTGVAYTGMTFGSESLVENINTIMSDEIKNDRTVPTIRGGNISAGGSISTDFAIDRFGVWMEHLLACSVSTTTEATGGGGTLMNTSTPYLRGAYLNTGVAANLYLCTKSGTSGGTLPTHTSGIEENGDCEFEYVGPEASTTVSKHEFSAAIALPAVGISIEKGVIGAAAAHFINFQGGRINSLDLSIPQEGIVQSSWGMLFKNTKAASTTSDASSVAYAVEDPVGGYEAMVSFDGLYVNRPLRDSSFRIANNFDESVFAIGSRTRRDLPEGRRESTGQITTYFEDSTEYDIFKNETTTQVNLSMHRAGEFCDIEWKQCKLTGSGTPQIGGPGVIVGSYNMNAFKSGSDPDVKITIYSLSATLR